MVKKCKIDGCDGKVRAKGLCVKHYGRIRRGIADMRIENMHAWHTRERPGFRPCKIDGCENEYYALGYCYRHYTAIRRMGTPFRRNETVESKPCIIPGCENLATKFSRTGLCIFHRNRKNTGKSLIRPKGNNGPLNVNWNNGSSEYPNHYELKKNRLVVLEAAKWICEFCGGPADRVHHRDKSKTNHSIENLASSCCSCNQQRQHRNKTKTSKFIRAYGKTAKEIAMLFNKSECWVNKMHHNGKLRQMFPLREEIEAILF